MYGKETHLFLLLETTKKEEGDQQSPFVCQNDEPFRA